MAKISPEINPSGIILLRESDTPLYVQLFEQFRKMILERRLRQGERVPASRILARELGVSRVIVSQCYEQLIMEGYLIGKTGAGTFVADILPDQLLNARQWTQEKNGAGTQRSPVRELAAIPETTNEPKGPAGSFIDSPCSAASSEGRTEPLPFQIGTPAFDMFPYKTWQSVGAKVLMDLRKYDLGYEDSFGYWPLRKAIADYLRMARGVHCEAEQVILVTGSQTGVNVIVRALLAGGNKVWMEDPGYQGALMAFRNAGMQVCPIPVTSDGLDIAYGIEHHANARMAYVTPSHQFPMGCTLSYEKRAALLEWARDNDSWILEDDYDSEFRYVGSPLTSLQGMDTHQKVIYMGTFSKVLFPGLRLAYVVLPSPALIPAFKQAKINVDRQCPIMDQLMLCGFMEGGHFLRHIRKMRLLYAERQQLLVKLIQVHLNTYLSVTVSSSGMHLVCTLNMPIDVSCFKALLKDKGVKASLTTNFSIVHATAPALLLGFTAFTAYKLKTGIEKLKTCLELSLVKDEQTAPAHGHTDQRQSSAFCA